MFGTYKASKRSWELDTTYPLFTTKIQVWLALFAFTSFIVNTGGYLLAFMTDPPVALQLSPDVDSFYPASIPHAPHIGYRQHLS